MPLGYGPKSEMPKVVLRGVKDAGIGKVKPVNWLTPTFVGLELTLYVGVVAGVKRGIVYPISTLSASNALNGMPVRAVKILVNDQPPNASPKPFPLLYHGVAQMGEITMRCRTSKSELPQSSFGRNEFVYPRLPR